MPTFLGSIVQPGSLQQELQLLLQDFGGLLHKSIFLLAFLSILPVATYSIVLHNYTKKKNFCNKDMGRFLKWFDSAETLGLSLFSVYFLVYYIPFYNKKNPATEAVTERTQLINELHAKREVHDP